MNESSIARWLLLVTGASCLTVPCSFGQEPTEPPKTEVRFVSRASEIISSAFPTSDVATSADGRWLAIAREDGRIELRHAANGRLSRIASGHEGPVYQIRFGPQARHLASAGHDGTVRLWSLPELKLHQTIKASEQPILAIAFTAPSRLVTGGYDGRVRAWDAVTGTQTSVRDLGTTVRCIDFVNGNLAVATDDKSVSLLSPSDLAQAGKLAHESGILAVKFTPDGDFLFSGSQAGVLSCWRVEERKRFYRHRSTSPVNRIAVSSKGSLVLAGADDGTVTSYRASTGEKLTVHAEGRTLSGVSTAGIAVSADDRSVWVCSRKAAVRFDAERPKLAPMLRFPSENRVWGLAVLPTPADQLQVVYGGKGGVLSIADLRSGDVSAARQHPASIDRLVVARDGSRIAAVGWKSPDLGLWTVTNAERQLAAAKEPLRAVAISPDGVNVIGIGQTGVLTEWKVAAPATVVRSVAAHTMKANWASYRQDGNLIATGAGVWQSTEPGEVKIWNARDMKTVRTLDFPTTWVQCAEFAPDGPLLAIALGNRQLRIYDTATNRHVGQLVHTHAVRTLCWSHDGRFLAAGTLEGTITVWAVASGERVAEFGGLNDVFAVQFAHGDHTLLAAGGGREWLAWDVSAVTGNSQPEWLQNKRAERNQ